MLLQEIFDRKKEKKRGSNPPYSFSYTKKITLVSDSFINGGEGGIRTRVGLLPN